MLFLVLTKMRGYRLPAFCQYIQSNLLSNFNLFYTNGRNTLAFPKLKWLSYLETIIVHMGTFLAPARPAEDWRVCRPLVHVMARPALTQPSSPGPRRVISCASLVVELYTSLKAVSWHPKGSRQHVGGAGLHHLTPVRFPSSAGKVILIVKIKFIFIV